MYPIGDPYFQQLRRQRRIEEMMVHHYLRPKTRFEQRVAEYRRQREPRAKMPELPGFDWSTVKGKRFYGPRV